MKTELRSMVEFFVESDVMGCDEPVEYAELRAHFAIVLECDWRPLSAGTHNVSRLRGTWVAVRPAGKTTGVWFV